MKEGDTNEDDGSAFSALLGAFGTNANPEKRAKSERMASMKAGDGRRRQGAERAQQYNGRITEDAYKLAKACEKARGYGSGGLIMEGAQLIARKYKVNVDG